MTTNTLKHVVAYTDGASANNQNAAKRAGGWAAVMMLVDANGVRDVRAAAYREMSGSLPGATNNQAELQSVLQVLLALKERVALTIHTDSEYVIGVLSRQWKPKQNQTLIAEVKKLLTQHDVTFVKVTGHSGVAHNERADALASAATRITE